MRRSHLSNGDGKLQTCVVNDAARGPLLIVGMTSLPSRLSGIAPALRSLASQSRRPDYLLLSLPRRSVREACDYKLPAELLAILSEYSWMRVNWVDTDHGPGTKVLGSLQWIEKNLSHTRSDDVLMILDDDHAYQPWVLEDLLHEQLSRGISSVCTFFAYFFGGLMVPQGADVIAIQLDRDIVSVLLEFHKDFVDGDAACFLVDDLWMGMCFRLCGREVSSLRDRVVSRGLETVYARTPNAEVEALMNLQGDDRRDRVTVRAFEGLLQRLVSASPDRLEKFGGRDSLARMHRLQAEVDRAARQMTSLEAWLEQHGGEGPTSQVQQAEGQLRQLKHLYRMQVPNQ